MPHSLFETRGKCLYSSFSLVKKTYKWETEIRKIVLLARKSMRATVKANPGSTKIYEREEKQEKFASRNCSGQTQAAADHKGAFKPKPLSFRLLALTSLEVESCL